MTTTNTSTRVIAYCRVSSEEQATSGISLAAQESKLRAYCTALDLVLVTVEIDAGISAKNLRRPALQRALSSLKRGEADTILVVKLDRLTRSVRDLCDLLDTYFRDGRYGLISLGESVDTRSAIGRAVLSIMVSIGQLEREQAGERTRDGLAYVAAQGRKTGGDVPYGYSAIDGALVRNEAEQTVIARALALRAAGLSLRACGETMAHEGMLARNGKAFAAGQVARLLGPQRAVSVAA